MPFMIKTDNPVPSKLCLGTVQFGLDYGIANKRGKVPPQEVVEIFNYAQGVDLNTLDTSIAYGNSEKIIGEYIGATGAPFEIISKIVDDTACFDPNDIRLKLQESLQRLNIKQLYGCLIHRLEDFLKHGQIWDVLEAAKKEGLVKKIGFSLYRPEDLDLIEDRGISFDMVQVPYSVFDRRFEQRFKLLKERKVEIHVRSVFLQGLAFLKPDQLQDNLRHASGSLKLLQEISQRHDLSISAICLNFCLLNPLIDKAVIGVDSLGHLKSNLHDIESLEKVSQLRDVVNDLSISDEDILLPYRWKQ